MKILRIIFIAVLIITVVAEITFVVLGSQDALESGDNITAGLLPYFTFVLFLSVYLMEFILYRTIGSLWIKKERYSKLAMVLNVLALIFSSSFILLCACCIANRASGLIYACMQIFFAMSVILSYEGASLNRKIKKHQESKDSE